MPRPSKLQVVREGAGLTVTQMAALVGLDAAEIELHERPGRYPDDEIVERYADALGMTKRAVLLGQEPGAVAPLFRSMDALGALDPWLHTGIHSVLGGFVRVVRERAEIRGLLADDPERERLGWLETIKPVSLPPPEELHAHARVLASGLRTYLGIEPGQPIPSMLAVAEQLGITTLFAAPEDEAVEPLLDGAALLDPDPSILVYVPGGGSRMWWRTRMVIAHELCHLLHDRAALDPQGRGLARFLLFSPPRSRQKTPLAWRLVDRFQDMETRANAFAGEFLAPTATIRNMFDRASATRFESIQRVSDHFMIGMTTAVNRLRDTFGLSPEQRQTMKHTVRHERLLGRATRTSERHPDAVPPGTGLRDANFEALVLRALAAGKLDAIAARSYLGLRASEPLPETHALSPEQRAPLVTAEQRARAAAERFLTQTQDDPRAHLGPLEQLSDGWRAKVLLTGEDGELREQGALFIDPLFDVRRLSG